VFSTRMTFHKTEHSSGRAKATSPPPLAFSRTSFATFRTVPSLGKRFIRAPLIVQTDPLPHGGARKLPRSFFPSTRSSIVFPPPPPAFGARVPPFPFLPKLPSPLLALVDDPASFKYPFTFPLNPSARKPPTGNDCPERKSFFFLGKRHGRHPQGRSFKTQGHFATWKPPVKVIFSRHAGESFPSLGLTWGTVLPPIVFVILFLG